jgi:hypothetical protein
LAATFAAMLMTAKIFSKAEAKQERHPKTTPNDDSPQVPKPAIQPGHTPLSSAVTPLPAPAPAD